MAETSFDSSELNFEYLLVMIFSFICLLGIFHSAMIALRSPTKDSPQKYKSDKPKKAPKTSELFETTPKPNLEIESEQDLEQGMISENNTDGIGEKSDSHSLNHDAGLTSSFGARRYSYASSVRRTLEAFEVPKVGSNTQCTIYQDSNENIDVLKLGTSDANSNQESENTKKNDETVKDCIKQENQEM